MDIAQLVHQSAVVSREVLRPGGGAVNYNLSLSPLFALRNHCDTAGTPMSAVMKAQRFCRLRPAERENLVIKSKGMCRGGVRSPHHSRHASWAARLWSVHNENLIICLPPATPRTVVGTGAALCALELYCTSHSDSILSPLACPFFLPLYNVSFEAARIVALTYHRNST
ncbi:hypothetical protein J6590_007087 [Homalodisca vitripennis]|nr:hypothetical protein J6590_007087 [Homalodisca vitripennis]